MDAIVWCQVGKGFILPNVRMNMDTLLIKGPVIVFQVSLFFCQAKFRHSGINPGF
jgi:hypothetical protein